VMDQRHWQGEARVTRGTHPLARFVAAVMRFPAAQDRVPVTVTMQRRGADEVWTRDFNGRRFRSTLRLRQGQMTERFGPMTFTIALHLRDGALHYPVTAGHCLGIPIPKRWLPISVATEVAEGQNACFDVALSLPYIGFIVRYQGVLRPQA
jgi:hypothetical protein